MGHAGTLDPAAEGVLVVAIGKDATTHIAREVAKDKEYEATITLGATSDTDDREGVITTHTVAHVPSLQDVRSCMAPLIGTVMQVPPAYSALKVAGTPAYKRARRGEHVALAPRQVRVDAIDILS